MTSNRFSRLLQEVLKVTTEKPAFPTKDQTNLGEHIILPFYSNKDDTTSLVCPALGRYWSDAKVSTLIFSNLYPVNLRMPYLRLVQDTKEDKSGTFEVFPSSEHYFQCAKYPEADRVFMMTLTPGQVASYGQRRLVLNKGQIKKMNDLHKQGHDLPKKKDGTPYSEGDKSEPQIALSGGFQQWDEDKIGVMYDALAVKFSDDHPDLRDQLLNTSNSWLIEHTKNDTQWADGYDGSGTNFLGKLLMFRREELRRLASSSDFSRKEWRDLVTLDAEVRDFLRTPQREFVQYWQTK